MLKLGASKKSKESRENGIISRSVTPIPSRPSTPKPHNGAVDHHSNFRSGMLTIRIFSGRGLSLSPGVQVPDVIRRALESMRSRRSTNNRESMQRKRYWWLPYVVLEFDKNEILIDAMGGDLSNPIWNYRADFDVSRTSNISVSAYLRTAAAVQGQDDMGNDLLMARVDLTLMLDGHHASDQWYNATAGSGSFHLKIDFKQTRNETLTIEAFDLLKVIGKGGFGKVMQVRKKDTQRIYALKTIRKAHIAQRPGEITHILAERIVLALVNNPFIVPLKFSFQNRDKLYLVMSFVNGGELFYHLQREGKFDQDRSRFYAAELLCALEHLHGFNVVYRDLKPENILLDYTGHIALCDFGLCKLNMSETEKTHTFCGTPEYIAPELLESQGYTKTVDWWTLGVLLYEMMTGLPPFYDENVDTMYQRILTDPLNFPPDIPSEARSVITGLLQRDPTRRLGANGGEEIKRHPFFAKYIDWNKLLAKKIQPPSNLSSPTQRNPGFHRPTNAVPARSQFPNVIPNPSSPPTRSKPPSPNQRCPNMILIPERHPQPVLAHPARSRLPSPYQRRPSTIPIPKRHPHVHPTRSQPPSPNQRRPNTILIPERHPQPVLAHPARSRLPSPYQRRPSTIPIPKRHPQHLLAHPTRSQRPLPYQRCPSTILIPERHPQPSHHDPNSQTSSPTRPHPPSAILASIAQPTSSQHDPKHAHRH